MSSGYIQENDEESLQQLGATTASVILILFKQKRNVYQQVIFFSGLTVSLMYDKKEEKIRQSRKR